MTTDDADAGVPDDPIRDNAEVAAECKRAIEAIVLVALDPVPHELLAQLLEQPTVLVEQWCDELAGEYRADERGFELVRVAGGVRFQTAADLSPYVERFLLNDQRSRLSGAALETLAIVAYKQPISKAQVASIRGVDPDGVLRTLQGRGYVDEVGRDTGPGQAILYGTTPTFLDKLGLESIDDLPPISEFIPGADVVEALEHGLRVTPSIDVSVDRSADDSLDRSADDSLDRSADGLGAAGDDATSPPDDAAAASAGDDDGPGGTASDDDSF